MLTVQMETIIVVITFSKIVYLALCPPVVLEIFSCKMAWIQWWKSLLQIYISIAIAIIFSVKDWYLGWTNWTGACVLECQTVDSAKAF